MVDVKLWVDVNVVVVVVVDSGSTAMWTKARASLGKSRLLANRAATIFTCVMSLGAVNTKAPKVTTISSTDRSTG